MQNNYKKIKSILWIILFANMGTALLKILAGTAISSASLVSDGYHSITDGASNIVGIIGIYFASKPHDKEHPYGHSKFEVITGLFIGMMLLFIAGKVSLETLSSFKNPSPPNVSVESLIALIITLIINVLVSTYEYKKGKELNSHILISDSVHTKSDIFISIGVLVTLVGVKLGLPAIIDPIASLVVAGFVLHAAYEIFKSTIDILVDRATVDDSDIEEILKQYKEVKDFHNIRSRGSEFNIHVDMHIIVDSQMTVEEAHKLSHDIEESIRAITNKHTQVIAHIEPYHEDM